MDCNEAEKLISGYIDLELPDNQRALFEEHCRECPRCQKTLHELTELENYLKESSEEILPDESYWPGFDARLKEKLDEAADKKPWWQLLLSFKKQLALALVAIFILVGLFTPSIREMIFAPSYQKAPQKPGITGEEVYPGKIDKAAEPQKDTPMLLERDEESGKGVSGSGKMLEKSMEGPIPTTAATKADKSTSVEGKPRRIYRRDPFSEALPGEEVVTPPEAGKRKKEPAKEEKSQPGEAPAEEPDIFRPPPAPGQKFGAAEPGKMILKKETTKEDEEKLSPAAPSAPTGSVIEKEEPAENFLEDKTTGGMKSEEQPPALESPLGDETDSYLARSEVLLLRILNMPDNPESLEMLRQQLKQSNFIRKIKQDRWMFSGNPKLQEHAREMLIIAERVMKIDYNQINHLKRKVIESGILQKTRELRMNEETTWSL